MTCIERSKLLRRWSDLMQQNQQDLGMLFSFLIMISVSLILTWIER